MYSKISKEQVTERIRNFVSENYLFGYDENELCDDSSLLELGIIDSTGILELVVFLEKEFNVEVLDEEILPENLDSINCISSYVSKKLNLSADDVAVGRWEFESL